MTEETNNKKAQDIEEALNEEIVADTEAHDASGDSDDVDYDVDSTEDAQAKIKKLKEKLKISDKEKMEYLDGWQRIKADFVNARKRNDEERKELIKYSTEGLVDELIPVLQNFEMAFSNKEAWEKVDKNWRMGVEYIYQNLKGTLESKGLKEINPVGEVFNPSRDEAVEHIVVDSEDKDHKVIEVLQKGYELNGKMLRPTRVKVGEYKKD